MTHFSVVYDRERYKDFYRNLCPTVRVCSTSRSYRNLLSNTFPVTVSPMDFEQIFFFFQIRASIFYRFEQILSYPSCQTEFSLPIWHSVPLTPFFLPLLKSRQLFVPHFPAAPLLQTPWYPCSVQLHIPHKNSSSAFF